MKTIEAICPGTFGEFAQGKIQGQNFLVTSPINRFSKVNLKMNIKNESRAVGLNSNQEYFKTEKVIQNIKTILRKDFSYEFAIASELQRGKGLASSSADLVAASSAILSGLGINSQFHAPIIARAASLVEPTDGVMYPGSVCFNQHAGKLLKKYKMLIYRIVGVILPGAVDTVSYDSKSIQYSESELASFESILKLIEQGFSENNLYKVGWAATESARINQSRLNKPSFSKAEMLGQKLNLPGIVVAHSGTAIGLLISNSCTELTLNRAKNELENIYGVPAEIFESWSHGPKVQVTESNSLEATIKVPRLVIRGEQPILNYAKLTSSIQDESLFEIKNHQGQTIGVSILADTSIEKISQICALLKGNHSNLKIEEEWAG